jgi:hypothetical protein
VVAAKLGGLRLTRQALRVLPSPAAEGASSSTPHVHGITSQMNGIALCNVHGQTFCISETRFPCALLYSQLVYVQARPRPHPWKRRQLRQTSFNAKIGGSSSVQSQGPCTSVVIDCCPVSTYVGFIPSTATSHVSAGRQYLMAGGSFGQPCSMGTSR